MCAMSELWRKVLLGMMWLDLFAEGSTISTVRLEDYCRDTFIMILEDTVQMRVTSSLRGLMRGCDVTIEGWYTWNRLMVYFDSFNLPCSWGSLSLIDGLNSTVKLEDSMCRTTSPVLVYTTSSRYLRILLLHTNSSEENMNQTVFSAIITAFADTCNTQSFRCQNGRCIDSALKCNGHNSCGDNTSCLEDGQSAAKIIRIVVGTIISVCTVVTVIAVVCHFCERSPYRRQSSYCGQYTATDANKTMEPVNAFAVPEELHVDAIANCVSATLPVYPPNFTAPVAGENMFVHQDDHSAVIHHQDGHVFMQQPDGNLLIKQPDGLIIIQQSDGRFFIHPPETVLSNPDDGDIVLYQPETNLSKPVVMIPEIHLTTDNEDTYVSYASKNGTSGHHAEQSKQSDQQEYEHTDCDFVRTRF